MSRKSVGDWTEESCLQLIREYKARPVLWDTSHLLFYKTSERSAAWENIGQVMNIPAKDCKHKMNILMSSLRREKFKMRQQNSYISRWFALNEMKFLINKNDSEKDSDIMDDDPDITNASIKLSSVVQKAISSEDNMDDNHHQGTSRKRRRSSVSEPGLQAIKFELSSYSSDDEGLKLTQHRDPISESFSEHTHNNSKNEDEINSFTSFIACKMRKMSEQTKNAVQRQILDIVFKAD